jgi:hypothetical protein
VFFPLRAALGRGIFGIVGNEAVERRALVDRVSAEWEPDDEAG